MLTGVGITMWIIVGAQLYPPPEAANTLCVSTTRCDDFRHLFFNASEALANVTISNDCLTSGAERRSLEEAAAAYEGLPIYRISYIWYSLIAVVIVVVVGIVVSLVTGANDANTIDAKLISPIYHFCCGKLPPKWRKRFACRKEEEGEKRGEQKREEEKREGDVETTSSNL